MERYLDAASKISRLAIGDPQIPVMVNIHPLPQEGPQDNRVDGLPFGTRGGTAIRSYFPLDAEYDVQVDLAGQARNPHQLEITVDGERQQLVTIGSGGGRGNRGGGAANEYRIAVKAGPHTIGVTFVQITEALDEATLRPRQRTRGTQPAVASVTIRGPYNATGPRPDTQPGADFEPVIRRTPRRKRPARSRSWTGFGSAGLPPASVTDQDLTPLLTFFEKRAAKSAISIWAFRPRWNACWSARSFCIASNATLPGSTPGVAHAVSDLELASRLFSSLFGAVSRMTNCWSAAAAGQS